MNRFSLRITACIVFSMLAAARVFAGNYDIMVDDHNTVLPTDGQYYNSTGGDIGVLHAEEISYSWDGASAYTAKAVYNSGLWTWGGMWYSLIKIDRDNIPLDFKAIFSKYVKSAYQGEITGIKTTVKGIKSPSKNSDLQMRLELKKADGSIVDTKTWDVYGKSYPQTFTWTLSASQQQKIEIITWVMDRAQVGDEISVDSLKLQSSVPDLATADQAFLWSFSELANNFDSATGMVQDRSNFHIGDDENVTATGKFAKVAYYAYKKGFITLADAVAIITKIADTAINVLPRGPVGKNTLWPHFTKNGGTEPTVASEWSSADAIYTAMDIIAALQMVGDPKKQISQLVLFLQKINWKALLIGGGISHGYKANGSLITYYWKGFGMETIGVNWAYASATGKVIEMGPQPTYNGSGFIDNAHYPMVFFGIDRWGNNWDAYRIKMADIQINWYAQSAHKNSFLSGAGLFGLSGGEYPEPAPNDPDFNDYVAYGVGGESDPGAPVSAIIPAEDGNHEVILLHYSGMIADIRPAQAKKMWETLVNKNAAFLSGRITVSPLNNLESLRVNKTNGSLVIKQMNGSWNLALQAEGWALADPTIKSILFSAVQNNAFLKKGYELLRHENAASVAWVCYQ